MRICIELVETVFRAKAIKDALVCLGIAAVGGHLHAAYRIGIATACSGMLPVPASNSKFEKTGTGRATRMRLRNLLAQPEDGKARVLVLIHEVERDKEASYSS